MFCIGLTGNIACGKSTALNFFKAHDIMTISADLIARELTENNHDVITAIRNYFGQQVFDPQGLLNRRALRERIFNHPEQRQWLEQLLHPLIRQKIEAQIKLAQSPYCVIEIPLLYELTHYSYLNRVLLITCDETIQLQRLMARDHCDENHAKSMIQTQPDISTRMKQADDIIQNNNTVKNFNVLLEKQHAIYLKLSDKLKSI